MGSRSVTISGATGLIGARLVGELQTAGWQVTVLTRDPERARKQLGPEVKAHAWDLLAEPAPVAALSGREAVVSLAGAPVSQRWSAQAKQAIRETRVTGTENLLAGLRAAEQRPTVLVGASATGYYGPRGSEPLDEEAPPGRDFLAEVCLAWEGAAEAAAGLGMRVAVIRTGVVLDGEGGALEKMLPPFNLGIGGPIAGGRQFLPWIHAADVVGMYRAALEDERWTAR